MTSNKFVKLAKEKVTNYFLSKEEEPKNDFMVSIIYVKDQSKILQNYKALLSISYANDDCYYEVTYDGNKKELYLKEYSLDAYKSFSIDSEPHIRKYQKLETVKAEQFLGTEEQINRYNIETDIKMTCYSRPLYHYSIWVNNSKKELYTYDWIVTNPDGTIQIVDDRDFKVKYKEINYE